MSRGKNRTRKADTFWSKPDGLSIVDVLALGFSAAYYLIVVMAVMGGEEAAALAAIQANMNLPISTILGGYFGDQIVQHWHRSKPEAIAAEKEDEERPTI